LTVSIGEVKIVQSYSEPKGLHIIDYQALLVLKLCLQLQSVDWLLGVSNIEESDEASEEKHDSVANLKMIKSFLQRHYVACPIKNGFDGIIKELQYSFGYIDLNSLSVPRHLSLVQIISTEMYGLLWGYFVGFIDSKGPVFLAFIDAVACYASKTSTFIPIQQLAKSIVIPNIQLLLIKYQVCIILNVINLIAVLYSLVQ